MLCGRRRVEQLAVIVRIVAVDTNALIDSTLTIIKSAYHASPHSVYVDYLLTYNRISSLQ